MAGLPSGRTACISFQMLSTSSGVRPRVFIASKVFLPVSGVVSLCTFHATISSREPCSMPADLSRPALRRTRVLANDSCLASRAIDEDIYFV